MRTLVYIDGANLDKGVRHDLWQMDYLRFFIWLQDKYAPKKVYIFLGFKSEYSNFYSKLKRIGYNVLFKEVIAHKGQIKANCDAELILKCVRDHFEGNQPSAILISGDGDFSCLVDFLIEKSVFKALIAPNRKVSYLLRKKNIKITFLNDLKNKLKRKTPDKDKTM